MKKATDIVKSTLYMMSLLPPSEALTEMLLRLGKSKLSALQKLEFVTSLCALYGVLPKSAERGWKYIEDEIEKFRTEEETKEQEIISDVQS